MSMREKKKEHRQSENEALLSTGGLGRVGRRRTSSTLKIIALEGRERESQ